jgi:hypothetical protein
MTDPGDGSGGPVGAGPFVVAGDGSTERDEVTPDPNAECARAGPREGAVRRSLRRLFVGRMRGVGVGVLVVEACLDECVVRGHEDPSRACEG